MLMCRASQALKVNCGGRRAMYVQRIGAGALRPLTTTLFDAARCTSIGTLSLGPGEERIDSSPLFLAELVPIQQAGQ